MKVTLNQKMYSGIIYINFEIKKKGVLGLLGSNGAGKSTTMNIICGVLSQTAGEVYINGINTRENPVEAKKQTVIEAEKPEKVKLNGNRSKQRQKAKAYALK